MRRFPLMLLLAVLAAGCGGDREGAVQTAERWLRAVSERDADAACALMSESAVGAIRKKSGLDPNTTCPGAVRAYSDEFRPGDVDELLKIGFEAEGAVRNDEVGVFPKSGPRELQVVLMRRVEGRWEVASTSIGPTVPGRAPTPTPTPARD